jgi:hypothetical protein
MTYRCDREKKKKEWQRDTRWQRAWPRDEREIRERGQIWRGTRETGIDEREREIKRDIRKGDTIEAKRCERGDICAGEGVKILDEKI